MKFSTKLILSASILVLIVGSLMGGMSFYTSRNTLEKEILQSLATETTDTLSQIDRLLYGAYQGIQSVASHVKLKEHIQNNEKVGKDISALIHLLLEEELNFSGPWFNLMVLDTKGNILAQTEDFTLKHTIMSFKESHVAFSQAMDNKIYYSDAIKSEVVQAPSIIYSAPLKHLKTDRIIGVVLGYFNWNAVLQILNEHPLNHHFHLANKEGLFIGGSDEIKYGMLFKKTFEKSHKERGHLVAYASQKGYLKFKGHQWVLFSDVPRSIAFLPAHNMAKNFVYLILAMLILFVLVFYVIGKQLTAPIGTLMYAVKHLASGNLEAKADISSADEIGALAKAFNKMTSDLYITTVSRDYVDNIIQSMNDVLLVIAPNGYIETVNHAALNVLGYSEKELIGKPFSTVIAEEEEEEEEEAPFKGTRLQKLLKEGVLINYAITYKSKSGVKIPMNFSGSVMRDIRDKVIGLVCVAKDMREFNRLQAQLIQAGKMTAMGEFVFGVAHEVNNPLSGSLGIMDMYLRKLKKTDPYYSQMVSAKDGLVRATTLIKDLLVFSRPDEASMKLLDIHGCIDQALSFAGKRFRDERIEVETDYQKDVPQVFGSSKKLEQVFLNLISNALDAILEKNMGKITEGGKLLISTKLEGDSVLVVFKDSGCGIKKDQLDLIFNPFHTTKSPGKGTGLGLSIMHTIISAHGGKIGVESMFGKGSSFEIRLPITDKRHRRKAA